MGSRRSFIASLFAASVAPSLSWADVGRPSFLAAAREADGSFALYGLRMDGTDAFRVPLAARGHAGTGHPTRPEAVVFARRPGEFALVLDCSTGNTLAQLAPPKGQYFNGHGTFSRDGSVLYTVENIAETSEGVIGIWQRDGWRRIGQVGSGGLGPHEVLLLPGRDDLVVANGGLVTDLSSGDEARNIATMKSSLAYLSATGELLDKVELSVELQRDSIRHLAVRADGLVAFAMQWQGEGGEDAPLMGMHVRGEAPTLMQAPEVENRLMRGYVGSIAFDNTCEEIAISSPKGGVVQIFDTKTGFLTSLHRPDLCGLATAVKGMLVSDGTGGVSILHDQRLNMLVKAARAWDNHIVSL